MMDTLLADLRLWQGKLEEAHNLAEKGAHSLPQAERPLWAGAGIGAAGAHSGGDGTHRCCATHQRGIAGLADTAANGPIPLMAAAGARCTTGAGQSTLALTAMARIAESSGRAFDQPCAGDRPRPARSARRSTRSHRGRTDPRTRAPIHPRRDRAADGGHWSAAGGDGPRRCGGTRHLPRSGVGLCCRRRRRRPTG